MTDATYPNRLYVSFDEFGGCGEHANFCGGINPWEETLPADEFIYNYKGKPKKTEKAHKLMYQKSGVCNFNIYAIIRDS